MYLAKEEGKNGYRFFTREMKTASIERLAMETALRNAIDHGLGLYTLYFHLESSVVNHGDLVERGQTIGTVGATGRATGPHLHFGAHVAGARIDPATLFALRLRD